MPGVCNFGHVPPSHRYENGNNDTIYLSLLVLHNIERLAFLKYTVSTFSSKFSDVAIDVSTVLVCSKCSHF